MTYEKLTKDRLDTFIQMRIRQLREEDATEDIDLVPALRDYYNRHMVDGTFVSWLAIDGDRIVGTSGMSFVEKPPYFGCPSGKMGILCSISYRRRDYCCIRALIGEVMENNYEIAALPKEQWKGKPIPLTTRSDSYYDFEIDPLNADGCTVKIIKKQAEEEIIHTPEEYDFPDSLYQDHWENAKAYGVVGKHGELLACIEVCPEEWSNRLMVTELWVSDELRGMGIGKRLMDKAKNVAREQNRRAIILETQSCNTNAIGCYLHEGFELIGFDTCCYTNDDIERREVRINLGFFFHREARRR